VNRPSIFIAALILLGAVEWSRDARLTSLRQENLAMAKQNESLRRPVNLEMIVYNAAPDTRIFSTTLDGRGVVQTVHLVPSTPKAALPLRVPTLSWAEIGDDKYAAYDIDSHERVGRVTREYGSRVWEWSNNWISKRGNEFEEGYEPTREKAQRAFEAEWVTLHQQGEHP
jgi:hypothetical protein